MRCPLRPFAAPAALVLAVAVLTAGCVRPVAPTGGDQPQTGSTPASWRRDAAVACDRTAVAVEGLEASGDTVAQAHRLADAFTHLAVAVAALDVPAAQQDRAAALVVEARAAAGNLAAAATPGTATTAALAAYANLPPAARALGLDGCVGAGRDGGLLMAAPPFFYEAPILTPAPWAGQLERLCAALQADYAQLDVGPDNAAGFAALAAVTADALAAGVAAFAPAAPHGADSFTDALATLTGTATRLEVRHGGTDDWDVAVAAHRAAAERVTVTAAALGAGDCSIWP